MQRLKPPTLALLFAALATPTYAVSWDQSNELSQADLLLDGSLAQRTKWTRLGTTKVFDHQNAFEVINSVVLPGTSSISTDGTVAEHKLEIEYVNETKLRLVGSPEALATAKLIKRGVVKLDISTATSAGWGVNPWHTNIARMYGNNMQSVSHATGIAGHEVSTRAPATHSIVIPAWSRVHYASLAKQNRSVLPVAVSSA